MNRGYPLEYQVTLQSLFEELDEESGVFDTSMRLSLIHIYMLTGA